MTTVQEEIERMVNKYTKGDIQNLFRAELQYLVLLAERNQIIEDQKMVIKIIKEDK